MVGQLILFCRVSSNRRISASCADGTDKDRRIEIKDIIGFESLIVGIAK